MSFWPYAAFVRFDNTKVNTLFIFTLKKNVSPNTVLLQLTAAVHKKKSLYLRRNAQQVYASLNSE